MVAGAATLNLRNLVLGAVMRPRLEGSRLSRALRSWFLTDEAVGLAILSGVDASRAAPVDALSLMPGTCPPVRQLSRRLPC